ncbi:MAG: TRAP transporter large permease subunit [Burkholderiales bacterium]|nr:TRAP transporter large permease subunit [Burkholderiales bacterium]MBH2017451.1 TRAP transporter large permease subunit [Burkholderiales bacterium]
MNTPASRSILGRTFSEWFSSLPVFALLLVTLIIGTGEMVHGQLLKVGESMFGDPAAQVQYFMLRADPTRPECNPNLDIEAEVKRQSEGSPKEGGDDIDDLFGDEPTASPEILRKSIQQSQDICRMKHDLYEKVVQHLTPQVKLYRTIETSFFGLFQLGTDNRSLILLLMVAISAITTTIGFHHIGIRPGHYSKDYLLQSASQVVSSALLLYSSFRYFQILSESGVPVEHPLLHYIWMAVFAILLLINLKRVVAPVKSPHGEGDWTGAFLSIPLYAHMATVAGVYFLIRGHDAGLAIYINQLMELPSIFMNLGLFIWSGMLLKQSRIVDLFMNILRPWSLSPQMLTYIILIAAAWATAYTGASGVFVIAAGGIIYHEVRSSGGSRQFALAATAMSGSLGVVLRPCLLVVLIAALNKQVTTTGLYHWGFYVFLLTSTLFFLASQMLRTEKASIESPRIAMPAMLRQIVPTIPYLIVVAVVVWLYEALLETKLNEITAPTIMPVILLIILIYDKVTNKGKAELTPDYASHRQEGVEKSIRYATNETIGHIGALLSLMTLSLAMGGVIERSEVMGFFPKVFENHWTAMTFLVVTKVLLGMIMDPFGAVVLVSGTLAPIAYANNIDPLHFWMMVLVAFELGYLLPPVAINQLLTRQVIGEEEVNAADKEVKHLGFYRRYERWILPLAVMTVGLAVVSYAPLAVHDFPELKFIADWFPLPAQ